MISDIIMGIGIGGLIGMLIGSTITRYWWTKSLKETRVIYDKFIGELKGKLIQNIATDPKLKSSLHEEFVDTNDILAWAIRGKHIERALDKQGMDYVTE